MDLRLTLDIGGAITSNPRVNSQGIADLAAEQLVNRHAKFSSFKKPSTSVPVANRSYKDLIPLRSQRAMSRPARALMKTGPPL